MDSHEQQLRNPRYRDWVKAGLALKYLKDGIQEFVDDEVKAQGRSILEEVRKELGRPDATCNQCSIDMLLPAHKRGTCGQGNRCFCRYDPQHRRIPCPNDVCGTIFDKIAQQHMNGRPSWGNTDSTKWCTSHWEIAKCFIDGGGYVENVSAADTDCKGLLSIVTNNMFIQKSVNTPIDKFEPKTDVFSKSRKARNEILHLASLEIQAGKLNSYVDVMIQLLGDGGKLHTHRHAKQAISKLRQLKKADLIISTEDEWNIRESALKAVEEKRQEALDEMDEKQKEILEKLQIEQLKESLDKLSKTSSEATQSLSNRQEVLEQRQTLLESTMKQMQELQSDTAKKIMDLQQELSSLKTKLTSSDKVTLLHKKRLTYLKHKKDLKNELICLYSKHLSTIPISPLLKKLDARVDDFYMELNVCDELVHERGSNRTTTQGYNNIVSNYRDIFYKENKRVENIFVLGDAGVGKSTWCLKLIDSWINSMKKQESGPQTKLNEDEKMLHEFDIVLFISLRHASKEVDLTEMIRNQIFPQTPNLFEYAEDILKEEPEKCLVVVDGLDEWNTPESSLSSPLGQDPSFPGRKDMNHCTVLTTTRPWKLDDIRPSYATIDRAIIIKGIKSNINVGDLARKVISKLNQNESHQINSNKKNAEDFVQEVKSRFHVKYGLPDLMIIPLIAIFMVLKWFKDGSLESTMAGNYSSLLENILDHEEGYRNIMPKYGQKRKYDGRLSSVPYLEQVKIEWSKEADMLPECLKKRPISLQYSKLILKLCKIAFEGLFENKTNTLVFSEEILLNKLTPEELEVSVKSGILSKTNIIGSISLEMSKLSFLHKTLQEYLAAIYLVAYNDNEVNPFQIFEKYCETYNRINEIENVILFACGIDTSLAVDMLKHVTKVEHSRMCLNKNQHHSFLFRLKCLREFRNVKFGTPVPNVPLNAINFESQPDFEDCLDLLKTDTNRIRSIRMHLNFLSATAQTRLLDCLSTGNYSFSNLTTLDMQFDACNYCCTRTKKRLSLRLCNLKELNLTSVSRECSKGPNGHKLGYVVFDFSECINLKKVYILRFVSCEMVFTDKKLKYVKLLGMSVCVVRIHALNERTPWQGEEKVLEQIDCEKVENSSFILSSTNFTMKSFDVKECNKFKVYLVDICHNGQATKMQSNQSSEVASLVCKKNSQCKIDVGAGITIQNVYLLNVDIIPNIPWGKVSCITLNQAMDLRNEELYYDILTKLDYSDSLISLHCLGFTTKVFFKLLKTIEATKFLQTLEIIDPKEPLKNLNIKPNIHGIKHLKFHGLNNQFLENWSTKTSNLCSIETLDMSSDGILAWDLEFNYLPAGGLEEKQKKFSGKSNSDILIVMEKLFCTSVLPKAMFFSMRSMVNLRCLKCQGFTEENFNLIGECLTELPHLEELGLSCFFWHILENQSLFLCLRQIKKLKTIYLASLSNKVSSAMAESLPNLGISELVIDDWGADVFIGCNCMFTDILNSVPNLEALKKLTIERLQEDHFTNLYATIPKLKEIEYIMLSVADEYLMPLMNLCDMPNLKTYVLKGANLEENNWQTFVQRLPSKGQLQTVKLLEAFISYEETERKIKSTPVFTIQEWECTGYSRYNITLKTAN
ncbi:uncharacterized protein LOC128551559 [Mercenaria mercenaria]|uniref:uncharacterized protein LOC128551559 n=1 Tax=Mercenaria mercenaria TaxID=6596 RepID=UPI00234F501D|nr:uncharacterized protein LOC128551559 [Mercenaria mercenaria]